MPKVRDVCRYVRSKNAGPFWVTVDLFFKDAQSFETFHGDQALSPESLAPICDSEPALVKVFPVQNLNVIKISYPRASAQGGIVERDMHQGQQYVRLLDIELGTN